METYVAAFLREYPRVVGETDESLLDRFFHYLMCEGFGRVPRPTQPAQPEKEDGR